MKRFLVYSRQGWTLRVSLNFKRESFQLHNLLTQLSFPLSFSGYNWDKASETEVSHDLSCQLWPIRGQYWPQLTNQRAGSCLGQTDAASHRVSPVLCLSITNFQPLIQQRINQEIKQNIMFIVQFEQSYQYLYDKAEVPERSPSSQLIMINWEEGRISLLQFS